MRTRENLKVRFGMCLRLDNWKNRASLGGGQSTITSVRCAHRRCSIVHVWMDIRTPQVSSKGWVGWNERSSGSDLGNNRDAVKQGVADFGWLLVFVKKFHWDATTDCLFMHCRLWLFSCSKGRAQQLRQGPHHWQSMTYWPPELVIKSSAALAQSNHL